MLASAVSAYIHRYGVLPGRDAVLFTNNDRAYQAAIDLADCGAGESWWDARAPVDGILPDAARRLGVTVMAGAVVMAAHGKRRVASVDVHAYAKGQSGGRVATLPCDLLAMSGGLSPVLHLHRAIRRQAAVAGAQGLLRARQKRAGRGQRGGGTGEFDLCPRWRRQPALAPKPPAPPASSLDGAARSPAASTAEDALMPLAGGRVRTRRARSQAVRRLQNDVAASDILLAAREGFEPSSMSSAIRRWASARIRASSATSTAWPSWRRPLGKSIPETGTTTYRPNPRRSRSAPRRTSWASSSIRCARPACTNGTPAARALFGRRQLEAAWYYPRRARTCTPPCAASAWRQRRRHPGCLHAGQDRYPGTGRGGLC